MALRGIVSPLAAPGPQHLLLKQLKTSPYALDTFFLKGSSNILISSVILD